MAREQEGEGVLGITVGGAWWFREEQSQKGSVSVSVAQTPTVVRVLFAVGLGGCGPCAKLDTAVATFTCICHRRSDDPFAYRVVVLLPS